MEIPSRHPDVEYRHRKTKHKNRFAWVKIQFNKLCESSSATTAAAKVPTTASSSSSSGTTWAETTFILITPGYYQRVTAFEDDNEWVQITSRSYANVAFPDRFRPVPFANPAYRGKKRLVRVRWRRWWWGASSSRAVVCQSVSPGDRREDYDEDNDDDDDAMQCSSSKNEQSSETTSTYAPWALSSRRKCKGRPKLSGSLSSALHHREISLGKKSLNGIWCRWPSGR